MLQRLKFFVGELNAGIRCLRTHARWARPHRICAGQLERRILLSATPAALVADASLAAVGEVPLVTALHVRIDADHATPTEVRAREAAQTIDGSSPQEPDNQGRPEGSDGDPRPPVFHDQDVQAMPPISSMMGNSPPTDIAPDGFFTYVVDEGFFGVDTFVYQIDDAVNPPTLATVTLTIPFAVVTPERPAEQPEVADDGEHAEEGGNAIRAAGILALEVSPPAESLSAEPTAPARRPVGNTVSVLPMKQTVVAMEAASPLADPVSRSLAIRSRPASLPVLVGNSVVAASRAPSYFGVDVAHNFLNVLDELREEVGHEQFTYQAIVGSTTAVSVTLSVGYVIWLIRGGVLLSSVLSSLPAWQLVDPLPVLGMLDSANSEDEADDDSLQALVAKSNARRRGRERQQ